MSNELNLPTWLQRQQFNNLPSPEWNASYRTQHWDKFLKSGLPTKENERFKYTDWSLLEKKNEIVNQPVDMAHMDEFVKIYRAKHQDNFLFVFIDGVFSVAYSDQALLPKGMIANSLLQALSTQKELIEPHWLNNIDSDKYPFASMNAAMFSDGLFLLIPANSIIDKPVRILFLATGQTPEITHLHHVILLKANARLSLVQEYYSLAGQPYFVNVVDNIQLEKDAHLELNKFQYECSDAIHMAHTFLTQNENSEVVYNNFTRGGIFSRDDVIVDLQEQGSVCRTGGFYRLCRDNQYTDNHVEINHAAPRSQSEMLYKGILDKKSRAVFNGRLHVLPDAQKILAYQANHTILLSKTAEVYSKPELEIYADDVKCKHGATTGQIDEEALFYMCSRGIHRAEATNILLRGFAEEVIQRVSDPAIKLQAREMVECHECGTNHD